MLGKSNAEQKTPIGTRALYRYFEKPEEADALTRGEVWVTTVECCRNTEDAARRDAGEATMTYNTGTISGSTDDAAMRLAMARMGIVYTGTPGRGTLINNQVKTKLVDAYVLCTTERGPTDRLVKMGPHCVRIGNAKKLYELTMVAMRARCKITAAGIDYVTYRERYYQGTEPAPWDMAYIKPPDKYEQEREIRLLWWVPPTSAKLTPFLLQCAEVVELCARVD